MNILWITLPIIGIASVFSVIQHIRIRRLQARIDLLK
jgi:hypothetical protein